MNKYVWLFVLFCCTAHAEPLTNQINDFEAVEQQNAAAARVIGPEDKAVATFPCNSSRNDRAVRFIQKTIQVTKITASKDVLPAKNSSPRGVNSAEVNDKNPPSAKLALIASVTPIQIAVSNLRLPG